ncbi:unnamed protein product, partial [Ectocarpus fasciculatus]
LELLLILLLGLSALLGTSAGGWAGSSNIGEHHRWVYCQLDIYCCNRPVFVCWRHRDLFYKYALFYASNRHAGIGTLLSPEQQPRYANRAREPSSPNYRDGKQLVGISVSNPRTVVSLRLSPHVCHLLRSWPSLDTHRYLYDNALTTLPEGLFQNTTGLQELELWGNELTTLPEGIFGSLTALEILYLNDNELTTLPEGIFGGLTALEILKHWFLSYVCSLLCSWFSLDTHRYLNDNELTTLPEGMFGGLTALEILWLQNNNLTTLPEGLFEGLTALTILWLDGNSLECLPSTTLVDIDDDATDGLHVDAYGGECGCSIEGVIDNVCGQETCTPGDEGYTCAATLSPVPAPALGTAAPEPAPQPTPAPGSSSEVVVIILGKPPPWPVGLPSPSTLYRCYSAARLDKEGASTVGVVVGVVVGALALAALGFFLRRRRATKSTKPDPPPPPSCGRDSLEYGRGEQHQQRQHDIHSSSPIIVDSAGGNATRGPPPPAEQSSSPPSASYAHDDAHRRDAWPPAASQQHALIAAETKLGEDGTPIQSLFPAPPMGALPKPGSEGKSKPTRDSNESVGGNRTADAGRGVGVAAEDGGGCVATAEQSLLRLTPTNSTADVSTEEGAAEVAGFGFLVEEKVDGAPSAAAAPASAPAAAPAGGRRRTSSGVDYGQAVLAAAEELAHHCQIPGVSEAATALSILIHLVLDRRDLTSSPGVKRCRSIVMMLERAAKGGDTSTEEERVLMEEVHDAVSDLVELIKTYQNKSKLAQVLTSTLFKRRQDELNAIMDRAIWDLHLGLQVQVGHDVAHLVKRSTAEAQAESLAEAQAQAESLAEARRSRRQRKLDQIEIPKDHVSITNEMLGRGGFGVVYLADYNGHNAAAKVQHTTQGLSKPGENDIPLSGSRTVESNSQREKAERKAFLRELDAMIRLRNPHTVNVYGAITSLPDRLVLVMELLAGGDLRAMLKNSEQPVPEDKCRQIIQDVCAGMAFLHSKAAVHGDLKSANVLLDGRGRAKARWIGDFGTSRWAQNTERSTGLATYTTNPGPSAHISFAWTAPEKVLESKVTSKASDVYSFGMVVWE